MYFSRRRNGWTHCKDRWPQLGHHLLGSKTKSPSYATELDGARIKGCAKLCLHPIKRRVENGGAQHAKPSWYLQLRTPGTVPRGCLFGAHDTGETAGVAQEESETSVVVTATVGSGHDYRTTIRDSGVRIVRFHISYSERVVSTRLRLSKSRRKGWVKSELSTAT